MVNDRFLVFCLRYGRVKASTCWCFPFFFLLPVLLVSVELAPPNTASQEYNRYATMLLHICLSLFLLPPFLSSVSATRTPRNDNLDVDPQKKALPILANPSSLHMYNSSTVDAVTMRVQTL